MSESAADLLFSEFQRQGPGADFESLCRAHPAHAGRLRELKAANERTDDATISDPKTSDASAAAAPSSADLLRTDDATIADAKRFDASAAAAPPSADLLRRIVAQGSKGARYAMRGEIARGGMGAILKVWDEDLGRELAMKIVLGRDGGNASGVTPGANGRRIARFLEEAQVTGQLDHPCVVPVHELGLDSHGQVYFTMRLVRGRDLNRIFDLVFEDQEGWTETRALNVLLRACEAMAYAHSKGVIHRDLKPGNVMVGSFGEVYVMDWGLARVQGRADAHDMRLREDATSTGIRTARRAESDAGSDSALVTMEGEVLGTPVYMPPEQARGNIDEISARSDVYSIGAMLYHLLARQMPYQRRAEAVSGFDVLRAVREGAPEPLRKLRDDVPAELEAICEKAMAREPAQRYADTLALAEDLRAFLEGRVVKAYQTGAIVELRKWVKRNKPLAAAAALAVLFLVAGLATSLYLQRVADRNAGIADLRAHQAADSAKLAEEQRQLATDNARLADERASQALAAAQRSDAMRQFLEGMLAKANPLLSMDRDIKVSTVVGEAVKQLDSGMFASQPEAEYGLRTTLGATYSSLSLLEESERQLRIAGALQEKLSLADPMTPVRFDCDFAGTLIARGKFAEGESHARRAIEALEALNAGESVAMARALWLTAFARYNLGAMPEALELMRRSLAVEEKIHGLDGEDTAVARSRLAFYLWQDLRLDEALDQLRLALNVLQSGSDRARFEATGALRWRASIYQTMRQWQYAEADLREALRQREALLGEESLGVADIVCDLPPVLLQTDKKKEAEATARRGLALRRKLLGNHRDTATALTDLAMIVGDRGDPEEARELLQESLDMRRVVLAPESAAIGDSLRRLGTLELEAGELDVAETYLTEALANWQAAIGKDHADVALIEVDLAKIHRARGEWQEATQLLEHAVAAQSAAYGETSPGACDTRDQLVMTLIEAKDWSRAETFLRELLPKYEAVSPKAGPSVAYTGAQLGAVLVAQENYDEAEPLLLAGWEAIGNNPRMWAVNKLFILDNLIALYEGRGDDAAAQPFREKAAALRR